MFIFVASKPIISKAWMLESEQMNEGIMWTHVSLLLIFSNPPLPPWL